MNITLSDLLKYWPVAVAFIAFVTGYTSLGSRVESLEMRTSSQLTRIQILETQSQDFSVRLAQQQKDIDYIKAGVDDIKLSLDRLTGK